MSPFCGIVSFDGAPVEPALLRRMMLPLTLHSDSAVEIRSSGELGAAWLQPAGISLFRPGALTAAKPIRVIADARLDNRPKLLRRLAEHDPATAELETDEDILWAAYRRWGLEWHRHLEGAVTAAVWDPDTRELVLLRDRAGERGLYWCRTDLSLLFASEPAMLVASGRIANEPSRPRLLAYLLGAQAEPTWSYFEGVHRVPEGHQVRLTADRVATECYWDWTSVTPEPWDGPDAAAELARRLQEAVDRRLAPQGETGVLLSGGLDSSSVAALAAGTLEGRSRRLWAFTWTSQRGDGIDETPLSRAFIRSRPNVVEHPVEADALWPFSRYPEAYADPNAPETNAFPDLLLATLEAARQQGVTVLMNGIGGDPVAGWLVPELALLLRGRFGALRHRWHLAGLRHAGLRRELRLLARPPRWPNWLTPQAQRQAKEVGVDRSRISWRTLSDSDRFRRFALASPANAAALERFDRLHHRCAVRIAAPWHDPDLGSLVLALPERALDTVPPGKRLVRAAMAGSLPTTILQPPVDKGRSRSGLWARGLLGGAQQTVERLLSSPRLAKIGLIDGQRLLAAYHDSVARQTVPPRLWEVLTAESWLLASFQLDII